MSIKISLALTMTSPDLDALRQARSIVADTADHPARADAIAVIDRILVAGDNLRAYLGGEIAVQPPQVGQAVPTMLGGGGGPEDSQPGVLDLRWETPPNTGGILSSPRGHASLNVGIMRGTTPLVMLPIEVPLGVRRAVTAVGFRIRCDDRPTDDAAAPLSREPGQAGVHAGSALSELCSLYGFRRLGIVRDHVMSCWRIEAEIGDSGAYAARHVSDRELTEAVDAATLFVVALAVVAKKLRPDCALPDQDRVLEVVRRAMSAW